MKFPRSIASLFRSSCCRLMCEPLEDRCLLSYTVTNLGQGYAYGLNNAGQVVGVSNGQAVLWQDGTPTSLGAGYPYSRARAINDVGQVVGRGKVDNTYEAFLWDNVSGFRALGALPGHAYSEARAVNDAVQVAGESRSSTNIPPRAVLWDSAGGIQDLGPLANWRASPRRSTTPARSSAGLKAVPGRAPAKSSLTSISMTEMLSSGTRLRAPLCSAPCPVTSPARPRTSMNSAKSSAHRAISAGLPIPVRIGRWKRSSGKTR